VKKEMITGPDQSVASRLLRTIIAKSLIEIIFVCAVATLAAFSNFSPLLRGAIDVADQTRVAGWVLDPLDPDRVIEVQLFIDGNFVTAKLADERRDDLVEAGVTTKPGHGFTFRLDSLNLADGSHTAQVYALRESSSANKVLIPISKTSRIFMK
jgi:hypothetical protein